MLLMRHNDPKLTTQTYTDKRAIQLHEELQSLPWIDDATWSTETKSDKWTAKWTTPLQKTGENKRQSENSNVVSEILQVLERNGLIQSETDCNNRAKWYLERGSNPHSLAGIGF